MKIFSKILLAAALSMLTFSSVHAIKFAGFQVTPELGVAVGKTNLSRSDVPTTVANTYEGLKNSNEMLYSGFARVWVGAFNFAIAPQIKYDYSKLDRNRNFDKKNFNNKQIGASIGYNLDFVVLSLTPYVGANHSTFGGDMSFENTIAYNYGMVAKIILIPMSIGIHGVYQEPKYKVGESEIKHKMNSIQLTLGFSI